MVVFGLPVAHEDDPQRAVLAALAMMSAMRTYDAELRSRRELGYPPFGRLLRIVLEGDEAEVERRAERLGERLRRSALGVGPASGGIDVLGPAPAPIERLRGRHRHQLLAKARDSRGVARLLAAARSAIEEAAARSGGSVVRVLVDVDPSSML